MIFGKTILFTSIGLILILLFQNTEKPTIIKKSLEYEGDKNNLSIFDDILLSDHKYEISDCLIKKFHCHSDKECLQVCNNKILSWTCSKGICTENISNISKPKCMFGNLRAIYDDNKRRFKYKCVCNSLYYGEDCSKHIKFCDYVVNDKCSCKKDSTLFKYYDQSEVCIPQKHYLIFLKQDHFKHQ